MTKFQCVVFNFLVFLLQKFLIQNGSVMAHCPALDSSTGRILLQRGCEGELITGEELTEGNTIYCYGYASCANATFIKSASVTQMKVRCYGAAACNDATFQGVETVFCAAHISCVNTNITYTGSGNKNLYPYGTYSLINSYIYTNLFDESLYIQIGTFGYAAAINLNAMNARVNNARGWGYYSFYGAKIRLAQNAQVVLWARLAGYNSYWYCPESETCNINCAGHPTACYGVTFDCHPTATYVKLQQQQQKKGVLLKLYMTTRIVCVAWSVVWSVCLSCLVCH